MSILHRYTTDEHGLFFRCPGCGDSHRVQTSGPGPKWTWNDSLDSPTFSPSILVTYGNWGKIGFTKTCHSFVKEGKIEFLNDCTHKLAGQTVPLPDWQDQAFTQEFPEGE